MKKFLISLCAFSCVSAFGAASTQISANTITPVYIDAGSESDLIYGASKPLKKGSYVLNFGMARNTTMVELTDLESFYKSTDTSDSEFVLPFVVSSIADRNDVNGEGASLHHPTKLLVVGYAPNDIAGTNTPQLVYISSNCSASLESHNEKSYTAVARQAGVSPLYSTYDAAMASGLIQNNGHFKVTGIFENIEPYIEIDSSKYTRGNTFNVHVSYASFMDDVAKKVIGINDGDGPLDVIDVYYTSKPKHNLVSHGTKISVKDLIPDINRDTILSQLTDYASLGHPDGGTFGNTLTLFLSDYSVKEVERTNMRINTSGYVSSDLPVISESLTASQLYLRFYYDNSAPTANSLSITKDIKGNTGYVETVSISLNTDDADIPVGDAVMSAEAKIYVDSIIMTRTQGNEFLSANNSELPCSVKLVAVDGKKKAIISIAGKAVTELAQDVIKSDDPNIGAKIRIQLADNSTITLYDKLGKDGTYSLNAINATGDIVIDGPFMPTKHFVSLIIVKPEQVISSSQSSMAVGSFEDITYNLCPLCSTDVEDLEDILSVEGQGVFLDSHSLDIGVDDEQSSGVVTTSLGITNNKGDPIPAGEFKLHYTLKGVNGCTAVPSEGDVIIKLDAHSCGVYAKDKEKIVELENLEELYEHSFPLFKLSDSLFTYSRCKKCAEAGNSGKATLKTTVTPYALSPDGFAPNESDITIAYSITGGDGSADNILSTNTSAVKFKVTPHVAAAGIWSDVTVTLTEACGASSTANMKIKWEVNKDALSHAAKLKINGGDNTTISVSITQGEAEDVVVNLEALCALCEKLGPTYSWKLSNSPDFSLTNNAGSATLTLGKDTLNKLTADSQFTANVSATITSGSKVHALESTINVKVIVNAGNAPTVDIKDPPSSASNGVKIYILGANVVTDSKEQQEIKDPAVLKGTFVTGANTPTFKVIQSNVDVSNDEFHVKLQGAVRTGGNNGNTDTNIPVTITPNRALTFPIGGDIGILEPSTAPKE